MRALVLGSAAGGGFPQWNCRCPVCALAWAGDRRVSFRTQAGVAVSADSVAWLLLNASPDLRQQILATPALQPQHDGRHSPIDGVVLTGGDVDQIAGLLTLRERQAFALYGSSATLALLAPGSIFGVLDPQFVARRPVEIGTPFDTGIGLTVTPFSVPGKVPMFLEGDIVDIGAETETTIGLDIAGGGKRLLYVPSCAHVNERLLERLSGADCVLFDGTTFTDDEMPRLGLSPKTASRMGHLAISGPSGSLARLASTPIGRKIYIHINNTNPVLVAGSPQRQEAEKVGWEIAFDGMEIAL